MFYNIAPEMYISCLPQERESLVDKWAEEFAGRDDKDQVLEADIDYWDKLQRQWDDISQYVVSLKY